MGVSTPQSPKHTSRYIVVLFENMQINKYIFAELNLCLQTIKQSWNFRILSMKIFSYEFNGIFGSGR